MYAIVDIETTGGFAANNDITEVAIVLHDGSRVIDRFETLVRPNRTIPYYIQTLTGISNHLVSTAPTFEEVAHRIQRMLDGKIFIAHNVNFDYSFLKHHLAQCGHQIHCQRICTVRLAKKIFPGLISYSLGNLCRHLEIPILRRHRAGGDVDATVHLFDHLLRNRGREMIDQFLKRGSREQCLPPHLPKEEIDKLPYSPGVYYFHDRKDRVLYVGKARNLKYRVSSHFTNNGPGRKRQEFLRQVHRISYRACSTELMAFILESIEIRRLWPPYNSSLKRFTPVFGLYVYEDGTGYYRFAIERKRKTLAPLYTFNGLDEGRNLLHKLVKEFALCKKRCHLMTDDYPCGDECNHVEPPADYNVRVNAAITYLERILPTFAVIDEGKHPEEQSCILMEKGKFYGMGYVPVHHPVGELDELKTQLTPYPESDYIRGLVYQYADKFPDKKIVIAH
ncbi:MAG TPA: exonuclease domain-containing protein [Flavitalea sp.]|nr:exonuclease domain-containing protein [Flavitalea sp.]